MKIDIFTHVMLPRYKEAIYKYADKFENIIYINYLFKNYTKIYNFSIIII